MTTRRFAPTIAYAPISVVDPNGATGAGTGGQPLASQLYVQSRGENLITNGTGLLGNNYNFSAFTFDQTETYAGAGSFLVNVAQGQRNTDEYMPVDPTRRYKITGFAKSGEAGGTNYVANQQYMGVILYDISKQIIWPKMWNKVSGSTDTTLAVALNPGDTTMTLTNATGWVATSTVATRTFSWWPYTNAFGYTFAPYTYTRNTSADLGSNTSLGTWAAGAIVGNDITLRVPWNGPALPVDTPVRNTSSGQSYKYAWSGGVVNVPNAWTQYTGYIGGLDTAGSGGSSLPGGYSGFPYGTAFVRLLMLVNYHGVANNNVRYSNVYFGEAETEIGLAAEITRATAAETALTNDLRDDELLTWLGM